jgi:hypothetical protein
VAIEDGIAIFPRDLIQIDFETRLPVIDCCGQFDIGIGEKKLSIRQEIANL